MNDVVDGGNIESSSGNVGGKEDSVGRGLEAEGRKKPRERRATVRKASRGEEGSGVGKGDAPIQVFQTLLLLELGVKREDGELKKFKEGDGASDSVDGAEEDEGATGVAEEEIVEIEILQSDGRCNVSTSGKGRVGETRRTFSFDMHSILLSWSVETIPSSEDKSMISGSASRKSSFSKRSSEGRQGWINMVSSRSP